LLKEVAAAVAGAARSGDLVARIGGDEFAAVLPAAGEPEAAQIARDFTDATTTACAPLLEDAGIRTTASAGFAICPAHGRTLDWLMRHADAAMTSVKRDGCADHNAAGVVAGS
jgi:diguanylate cyclase (GGDEF)-like protein